MLRNIVYCVGAGLLLLGLLSGRAGSAGAGNSAGLARAEGKASLVSTAAAGGSANPAGWAAAAGPAEGNGKDSVARENSVYGDTTLLVTPAAGYRSYLSALYDELFTSTDGPGRELFDKAITGFYTLQSKGRLPQDRKVISMVDFSRPSHEKRLWIVDLEQRKTIYHTWVAHGKSSGADKATRFSNRPASHQSSLGFYLTGEVYYGKHGRSLRLDGMDPGVNSNARERAIVLHGASYVSADFIRRHGRLGRSLGCPAVAEELADGIIDQIKEKTLLFIYAGERAYRSNHLDLRLARAQAGVTAETIKHQAEKLDAFKDFIVRSFPQ